MRISKNWTVAMAMLVGIAGGAALVESLSTRVALAQVVDPAEDRWQFHDGHWSYWSQPDKRWYYTNGNHWFYNDGKAWKTYQFDKNFGRKGFVRGEYRAPGPDVEVKVPNHKVLVNP